MKAYRVRTGDRVRKVHGTKKRAFAHAYRLVDDEKNPERSVTIDLVRITWSREGVIAALNGQFAQQREIRTISA